MENKNIKIKSNNMLLKIVIYIVLFVAYVFPTGFISTSFIVTDKAIFTIGIIVVYILKIMSKKKIRKDDLLFICIIVAFCIIGKSFKYFMFLTILLLEDIIKDKDEIAIIINKSIMPYICLLFTFLYSILNFGKGGRYAYTAIMEINQSGLSIFCLALIIMHKNKKIGWFTLIFGLLTVSRSYYLATLLFIISKTKLAKLIVFKFKNWIKYFNYSTITIISSFLLIGIGHLYLYKYNIGEIFWGDNISNRLINIFDYSNLYRFIANLAVIIIFIKSPIKLFTGLTKEEYINFGNLIYSNFNVPYKYTNPHNLFFSHLKLYGIFSVIEIIYVSKILKKIVNENNFFVYLAIVLYSIILGAGLYSYWLYLSVIAILLLNGSEENK